ncbi:hypothetical protein DPMN_168418 [Dreissena polymorpha]|uniref:ADP-ribosylation factor n=2 Tax=Dreissena polymorpha TaxID=45954 RepID=A0A9D4IZK7_DREPO|nr:hypothetical protein DPMN_168418 [Dreissena polymorpha]
MGGTVCKDVRTGERILFLGIPEAGKTTALYFLKMQEVVTTIPTHGYNSEVVEIYGKSREIWDIGGLVERRDDFLFCLQEVALVVFFIDCSDSERKYALALKKLELALCEDELLKCPVAIVANKQDLSTNITVERLYADLSGQEYLQKRFWKVHPCSFATGDGVPLLLRWVDKYFGKEKKLKTEEQPKPRRRRRRRVAHSSFKASSTQRQLTFMSVRDQGDVGNGDAGMVNHFLGNDDAL